MNVGYAIVGFIIGFVLAGMGGSSMVGAFGGLVMGLVFGRLGKLEKRLNHLESDLSSVAARSQQAPVVAPEVEEHPPEEHPPAGLVVDEPLPPAEQTRADTREPLPVAEESPWSRDEADSSPWM